MNINRQAGRPAMVEHKCICCGILFATSSKKCQHEYKKRLTQKKCQGKREKKIFKTSESTSTPSIAGSSFGTNDTIMENLVFDIPNRKKQQFANCRSNNEPTVDEFFGLAKSFLKTELGPKSANQ
jgi:hypothetical protein